MEDTTTQLQREITAVFGEANAMRSLIILLISILLAFFLSKVVAYVIIKIAQFVATISDNAPDAERQVRLRRVETYLSVAIALVRAVIVGVVAFYVWKLLSPVASTGAATIGASAFFIVLAGGTIGMILRDITTGSAMIIEGWFHVGDYISVEPFIGVSGVVERMTLRSTKLRSMNGEVVWLHNQHVHGVRVTPKGLRTIAVDVFVNNKSVGKTLIDKAIAAVPTGTLKVIKTPEITTTEKWGDYLWLFTVVAEMAPGREWLMEDYFIASLKELDERRRGPQTINALYGLQTAVMKLGDLTIIDDWRKLTTSDHFYYMCTKWFSDGDIHAYFSPYESPYRAYIVFMNAWHDLRLRLLERGVTL